MDMIIELLLGAIAVGAIASSLSNSKQANQNINYANQLNAETESVLSYSRTKLNNASARLTNALSETRALRESCLDLYSRNFVYYVSHINSNITQKRIYNNELNYIISLINEYVSATNNLNSMHLNEASMLLSMAAGGVAVGAASVGAGLIGASLSFTVGLSFFGVGSYLMSSYQLSKSYDYLKEAEYMFNNRYLIRDEINNKTSIIESVSSVFERYNSMLKNLTGFFKDTLKDIQKIYKKHIVDSDRNIKLIANREQPIIYFEECTEDEQSIIYKAFEECKVISEFARTTLLYSDGTINYNNCSRIGV